MRTHLIDVFFADLISIATRLLTLVQAFDKVAADDVSLQLAADKFKDLLEVSTCLNRIPHHHWSNAYQVA